MPIETIEEWEDKHGGEAVWVGEHSEMKLYPDGAMRECSRSGIGQLLEPPGNPLDRAKLIAQYHSLRLQCIVNDFDEYKRALLGNGFLPNRTENEHLNHLRHLKSLIDAEKAKLAEAERQLEIAIENDPGERARRGAAAAEQRRMQLMQEFHAKVREIEV